jgi:hypothetical protein
MKTALSSTKSYSVTQAKTDAKGKGSMSGLAVGDTLRAVPAASLPGVACCTDSYVDTLLGSVAA